MGPFAFGDALVAGEIAVRGYVSEATRHKHARAALHPEWRRVRAPASRRAAGARARH